MGTSALFLIALAIGGLGLALWFLARFPECAPSCLRRALLHFGIALVLVWAAPNAVEPLAAGRLVPALLAVFFLVLPPLVYACVAAASVLRFVREATEH